VTPLGAIYASISRTISTRARLVSFVALGVLGAVVAWRVGASASVSGTRDAVRFIDTMGLTVLAPIVSLVFGTAALGDLVDDGTLVYLWTRPQRRSSLALGAWGAALTYALPLVVVPTLASVLLIAPGASVVVGAVVCTAAATVAYVSLFVLLGLLTTRALMWGVGYVLIGETFVARGGVSLGFLSIRAHASSVLSAITGVHIRLAYFSAATSATFLVIVSAVAVVLCVARLRTADVA
jgi:ABC-2 type transport system permease protein